MSCGKLKISDASNYRVLNLLQVNTPRKLLMEGYCLPDPTNGFDYGFDFAFGSGETVNYAVKCIAANREYLTSPLGNYLPESLTDLDWEIDIISRDTGIEYFIIGAGDTDPNIELRILANDVVTLNIVFPGGLINPYSWVGAPPITSGKIGVKGTPTDIVFYFNDIEVSSTPINNTDLSDFINLDLTFNAEQFGTFYINQQNIEFKSVKLNEHEWLSPDWTAPTTTNSQGVITTLHSDVSTAAMIIAI